ncbi:YqzL family protein [Jeotgalibacillus soli]|uniref:YqzL family protein n=1 Tax=Jeotgalibacillus soli TaxID=889306 RepID=A0A0C2VIX8_9BACL|nr:YqzL family protein [Jeotgalibacillus soli]KIL44441.1 hypothetical protein KP78_34050 [Jeotgalibacillus soli]
MLDFTWKVFSKTGNIDTYLLLKEIEEQDEIRSDMLITEEEWQSQTFPQH